MSEEPPPNLELQIKISKLLAVGFVLSLLGTGGISSLAALILGLKARKIIINSNGEIGRLKMAWWCIIAGALGTIILPLFFISKLKN